MTLQRNQGFIFQNDIFPKSTFISCHSTSYCLISKSHFSSQSLYLPVKKSRAEPVMSWLSVSHITAFSNMTNMMSQEVEWYSSEQKIGGSTPAVLGKETKLHIGV